ncbi:TPA: hypothetical protein ACV1O4_004233 [Yersinia enterocolitica]|uniref:hypothetical protein n=1 Tax=Lelliottia aquatilis TaxID=2080838 RepID=UPI001576A42E|nr:hypothetical protein [Lelliottia aquatilis]NTZ48502.1 hypothetical protein [Lelliottia aquatilis]
MSYTYKVIDNSLFFIEEESNKQYEVNVSSNLGHNIFQVFIPDLSPRVLEANDAKELFNEVLEIENVRRGFKRQTQEEFKSKFQKMKKKACPE